MSKHVLERIIAFEYVWVISGLALLEKYLRCTRRPPFGDAGRPGFSLQHVENIWARDAQHGAGLFAPVVEVVGVRAAKS